MPTSEELRDWLDAACEAARRGAAVLEDYRGRFNVQEKGLNDLVTEADVGSQRAIHDYLASRYPSHGFLGEEGPGQARPGPDAPPTWIVDPLDGTTNYVHGCPMYCVTIGLQVRDEMVVGVVLDPSRDELFRAARGQGAWLGERRLRTSRTDKLANALLACGFPPDLEGQEVTLDWWRYFSLRTRSLRRTGSTALNLAYLAAGRFDGYWAFDNKVWDVAGGVVLVEEAGGRFSRGDGSPFDPYRSDTVASNGPLHAAMLEAFRNGPKP